jgi:hypothetical protein
VSRCATKDVRRPRSRRRRQRGVGVSLWACRRAGPEEARLRRQHLPRRPRVCGRGQADLVQRADGGDCRTQVDGGGADAQRDPVCAIDRAAGETPLVAELTGADTSGSRAKRIASIRSGAYPFPPTEPTPLLLVSPERSLLATWRARWAGSVPTEAGRMARGEMGGPRTSAVERHLRRGISSKLRVPLYRYDKNDDIALLC